MDLQIRYVLMLKHILENVDIKIFDFDEIVGRPTVGVIGCQTAINVSGDYIPDIWNDDGIIGVTMDASAVPNQEELEVLREAVRTFNKGCMPYNTNRVWKDLVGTWVEDAEAAKLKDPALNNGITPQSTSTLYWKKIINVGLRKYINECQEHYEKCWCSPLPVVDGYPQHLLLNLQKARLRQKNRRRRVFPRKKQYYGLHVPQGE